MTNIEIIKLLDERIAAAREQKEFYLDRVDNSTFEENQYNREQYFKYRGILDELLSIKAVIENEMLRKMKENINERKD